MTTRRRGQSEKHYGVKIGRKWLSPSGHASNADRAWTGTKSNARKIKNILRMRRGKVKRVPRRGKR